jgi:biotin carboxyl carrier protein
MAVEIVAPIPGSVVELLVKEGDEVSADDAVLVLEALKMENEIVAPEDGVVDKILATEGKTVDVGEVLITLK